MKERRIKGSKTLFGLLCRYWEKFPFRQIVPGFQKVCVVFVLFFMCVAQFGQGWFST